MSARRHAWSCHAHRHAAARVTTRWTSAGAACVARSMARPILPWRLLLGQGLTIAAVVAMFWVPGRDLGVAAMIAAAAAGVALTASGLRVLGDGGVRSTQPARASLRFGAGLAGVMAVAIAADELVDAPLLEGLVLTIGFFAVVVLAVAWILIPFGRPAGWLPRLAIRTGAVSTLFPLAIGLLHGGYVDPMRWAIEVTSVTAIWALLQMAVTVRGLEVRPVAVPAARARDGLAAAAALGVYGVAVHPLTSLIDRDEPVVAVFWCILAVGVAAFAAQCVWRLGQRIAAGAVALLAVALALTIATGGSAVVGDGLLTLTAAIAWAAVATSSRRQRRDDLAVAAGVVLAVVHTAIAHGDGAAALLAGDRLGAVRGFVLTALDAGYLGALAIRSRRAADDMVAAVPAAMARPRAAAP